MVITFSIIIPLDEIGKVPQQPQKLPQNKAKSAIIETTDKPKRVTRSKSKVVTTSHQNKKKNGINNSEAVIVKSLRSRKVVVPKNKSVEKEQQSVKQPINKSQPEKVLVVMIY